MHPLYFISLHATRPFPAEQMEMARAGAVPLLVSLMEKNNPPAAREAAAGAISNLACIKANQARDMAVLSPPCAEVPPIRRGESVLPLGA